MATRLYDDECLGQFGFTAGFQHLRQFLVSRVLRGRLHTQIQNGVPLLAQEHDAAEVPVSSDEQSAFLLRGFQQLFVSGSGEAEFRCSDYVLSQVNQKAGGGGVDVLVEEKPHQAGAARRRMSSAPTKAMA